MHKRGLRAPQSTRSCEESALHHQRYQVAQLLLESIEVPDASRAVSLRAQGFSDSGLSMTVSFGLSPLGFSIVTSGKSIDGTT